MAEAPPSKPSSPRARLVSKEVSWDFRLDPTLLMSTAFAASANSRSFMDRTAWGRRNLVSFSILCSVIFSSSARWRMRNVT
eukprot:CAMPEP_0204274870 /NCGR_PEP_ID=MMETSP0468-20130131/25430_1 /ASSEMBLY_ACC=CAM_ASM_000383 /TAXON_ID=2969 /ORGANISM="Oxyrrhis marina" /LENGTH=80 /DNA_ID=CAMNT_0051251131 /DNA_START=172 /DNA_END=414 /DNA_ORIENTATION=-